jgi:peptidoglycan hydrolase-like protein with peptidoglycan-binding domain
VNGIFDTRTVRAVKAFQRAVGITESGALDVVTWWTLLARAPAAVRWVAPGTARTARAARGGTALPAPKSAHLPALKREIPPKVH